MAQNVKKVASKNLKKPKVAENSKICQNSKKLPKISKVAEQLVAKPTDVSKDLTIPKIVSVNEAIAIHPQRLRGNTSMGCYGFKDNMNWIVLVQLLRAVTNI